MKISHKRMIAIYIHKSVIGTIGALLLLLTSCVRDDIQSSVPNLGGKQVVVKLELSIPHEEQQKKYFYQQNRSDMRSFTVTTDSIQPLSKTRSDGTTKLHNLWIFQFNADGSKNGLPQKISDEVIAVNDMVTLEVPLTVASNQTLYLVALGSKLEDDLAAVSTISQLEKWEFAYTVSQGGGIKSKITSDADIPFAGKIKGVNILEIGDGSEGLVEYNSPQGFVGNIPIRRLMAHIVFRYKFEVEGYVLEGLKLINALGVMRIENPDINSEGDNYITLSPALSETDADGYVTATWYVAQNKQGEKDVIQAETDRYYNPEIEDKAAGVAPPLGCNIEVWAYSTKDKNSYAVYQIYVGLNNTSNFDVLANNVYNLRTTINTDINSAQNDGRIRAYSLLQKIYIRPSKIIKEVSNGKSNPYGANYDLDSHFDSRPVTVNAKGKTVTIGVYTDEACTNLANPADSWLKLSSSSNYTDAVNNQYEPIGTFISTEIILPSELKFYLYNDEFVLDEKGEVNEPGTKRSIYIQIKTITKGEGGEADVTAQSGIYQMDQRAAIYSGTYGGEIQNGQYAKGLFHDCLDENKRQYGELNLISYGLPWGYNNVTADKLAKYDVFNQYNGRKATKLLSENPLNFDITADIGNMDAPRKRADGSIDLYQYGYRSYAARYCYERNRDENGNGKIDDEELKWYLPSMAQVLGILASSDFARGFGILDNSSFIWSTNTYLSTNAYAMSFGYGASVGSVITSERTSVSGTMVRCVREMEHLPHAESPAAYIYTTENGVKYGAIDASKLPRYVVDKINASGYYTDNIPLYEYVSGAINPNPILDSEGNQQKVRRPTRHHQRADLNSISANFIISPTDVMSEGNSGTSSSSWAASAGYLDTANTNSSQFETSAVDKGCPYYRGRNNDEEPGTWRLPTQREAALISIFEESLFATSFDTGFQKLIDTTVSRAYWTATESGNSLPRTAWTLGSLQYIDQSIGGYKLIFSTGMKNKNNHFRCIKDIPKTTVRR